MRGFSGFTGFPGFAGSRRAGGGTPAPLAFPALGYAYDFDWVNDTYISNTADGHTGTQRTTDNLNPILYKNMVTQAVHFVENADGSLATRTSVPRRSTKGLHSWVGLLQTITGPRDLANAAWVKASGVTATRNQTGRDGTASSATLLAWTTNDATVSQQLTNDASIERKLWFDLKRVSGTDPLQYTVDNGATWVDAALSGPAWNDWYSIGSARVNTVNPNIQFRCKAGNSFAIDFVNYIGSRDGHPTLMLVRHTRLGSNATPHGRDRINHNPLNNGGENGINIVRSSEQHGFYAEFSNSNSNVLLVTITGIGLVFQTGGSSLVVGGAFSGGGGDVTVPVDLDNGTATTYNKLMYYINGTTLRVAVNGVLYTGTYTGSKTTSTHDFCTSGAGSPMEGFVKRATWFGGSRIPTDAEMIAWTTR